MQRYFAQVNQNKVLLTEDDVNHVIHVMRNKVGDEIEVVFNNKLFLCEINSIKPLDIVVIKELSSNNNTKDITLFYALAKGEKISFVIQKATELGAKNIILFASKRCVVKLDNDDFNKKLPRYIKIAKEASEQSLRLDIPNIVGVYPINKLPKEYLTGNLYVAYEKEAGSTSSFYDELLNVKKDEPIGIAIGPEGGFEPSEIETLNALGFKNVSLGSRILRTETAAVYALSVIGFMLER